MIDGMIFTARGPRLMRIGPRAHPLLMARPAGVPVGFGEERGSRCDGGHATEQQAAKAGKRQSGFVDRGWPNDRTP